MAAGSRLGGTDGPGVHLVGADCVIDVAGATVDDHVAALPTRQRRTNFRREQRRFTDSGLEIRRVGLPEYWSRLGPLLAAVQQKYGHLQSAGEMTSRLRRQGEHLASRSVVFACFDGDIIVGFALAYQWGGELALRVVGFDYERLPGADEYAQLAVHAPLRYCYAHRLRRLHLGTASYEAKCRRGARPRPLWAVTSLPGPDPGSVARMARQLAASMPAHESASFTAQVEQSWRRWTALGA
jgi:predicted N-acyltransferase